MATDYRINLYVNNSRAVSAVSQLVRLMEQFREAAGTSSRAGEDAFNRAGEAAARAARQADDLAQATARITREAQEYNRVVAAGARAQVQAVRSVTAAAASAAAAGGGWASPGVTYRSQGGGGGAGAPGITFRQQTPPAAWAAPGVAFRQQGGVAVGAPGVSFRTPPPPTTMAAPGVSFRQPPGAMAAPGVAFRPQPGAMAAPGVAFRAPEGIMAAPGVMFRPQPGVMGAPGVAFRPQPGPMAAPGVNFRPPDAVMAAPGVNFRPQEGPMAAPGVNFRPQPGVMAAPGVNFRPQPGVMAPPPVTFRPQPGVVAAPGVAFRPQPGPMAAPPVTFRQEEEEKFPWKDFFAAVAVFSSASDTLNKGAQNLYDASMKSVGRERDVKELATMMGKPGKTEEVQRFVLEAQRKSRQTYPEALDTIKRFYESAQAVIGPGGKMGHEEAGKFLGDVGAFQGTYGGDAGTMGDTAATILHMARGPISRKQAMANFMSVQAVFQATRGKAQSLNQQFSAQQSLFQEGIFRPEEAAAIMASMAAQNPAQAGVGLRRLARATVGSVGRTKRLGYTGGEATGTYLQRLATNKPGGAVRAEQLTATDLLTLISDDLAKQQQEAHGKGENFNILTYLLKHGYYDEQARMALMQFHESRQKGLLATFTGIAQAPQNRQKMLDDILLHQQTSPESVAAGAQASEALADKAVGGGVKGIVIQTQADLYNQLREEHAKPGDELGKLMPQTFAEFNAQRHAAFDPRRYLSPLSLIQNEKIVGELNARMSEYVNKTRATAGLPPVNLQGEVAREKFRREGIRGTDFVKGALQTFGLMAGPPDPYEAVITRSIGEAQAAGVNAVVSPDPESVRVRDQQAADINTIRSYIERGMNLGGPRPPQMIAPFPAQRNPVPFP